MDRRTLGIRIGVVAGTLMFLGFVGSRIANSGVPESGFLKRGQVVYSTHTQAAYRGLNATETFMNVPVSADEALTQVRKELPNAIQRDERDEGPYFLVPQMKDGRILLSEFPEQKIAIRPGKLVRVGARMMVLVGTGEKWSHIQIQDYRQPSALESAFNWLGDKIGI